MCLRHALTRRRRPTARRRCRSRGRSCGKTGVSVRLVSSNASTGVLCDGDRRRHEGPASPRPGLVLLGFGRRPVALVFPVHCMLTKDLLGYKFSTFLTILSRSFTTIRVKKCLFVVNIVAARVFRSHFCCRFPAVGGLVRTPRALVRPSMHGRVHRAGGPPLAWLDVSRWPVVAARARTRPAGLPPR